MIDLLDIERVFLLATSYRKHRKDFARLSDKSCGEMTPKQREKSNADMAWAAMALIRTEASLHAACVDAGLADLRDESAYAERDLRGTGHHRLPFQPDRPRAYSRDAALTELAAGDADLLAAEIADNARQRMKEGLL